MEQRINREAGVFFLGNSLDRRRFLKYAGAISAVVGASALGLDLLLTQPEASPATTKVAAVTPSSRKSSIPTTQAVSKPESGKRLAWMINLEALDALLKAGLPENLVSHFFDNPYTFLMGSGNVPLQLHCRPTQVFTSFQTMQEAFAKNQIRPSTKAIVYDNEAWEFTPANEQANPASYAQRAAELVHDHDLTFVCTPATDLVRVLAPGVHEGDMFAQYLILGIAADAARYCDVFEIQAQGSEMNVGEFSQFVTNAAQQARQANSNVIVLAGLSTGPSGKVVTADQIYNAALSVLDAVEGFWLNIPGKGRYCPRCSDPKPELAVQFLQSLATDGY